MADIITCPSGLQGRVRGMKVREERVLADRKLAKSGGRSTSCSRPDGRRRSTPGRTRDADFLVDEFDRVDCGVDTTIELECPECFHAGGGAPFRQGVLPPGPGQDGEAEGPEQLFLDVNMETWREGIFQLCWQQHGGSGLLVTLDASAKGTSARLPGPSERPSTSSRWSKRGVPRQPQSCQSPNISEHLILQTVQNFGTSK